MHIRILVARKMIKGLFQRKITVQNIIMKFRNHDSVENLLKICLPALNSDSKKNPKKTAPDLLRD